MKDGFVRCASATVDIKVADTDYIKYNKGNRRRGSK